MRVLFFVFICLFTYSYNSVGQSCPTSFTTKNQFCISFQWAGGEPSELPTRIENISGGAGGGQIFTPISGIGSTNPSDDPYIKYYGTGSSSCNTSGYSGSAGEWRITYPSGTIDCSYSASGALPVVYSNYRIYKDDGAILQWTTSSEVNNDFFEIERSSDGKYFVSIGKVDGAGNSNDEMNYSFWDPNPFSGISYYRIVQHDFDGKTHTGDILIYNDSKLNDQVFFNKANEEISIINRNENKGFMLFDLNGRLLKRGPVNEGVNNLAIENIPKGIYYFTLTGKTMSTHKVLIY